MKKTEEVTLLYEISKALGESLDLRKSLYKVLDILFSSMDMVRGTITILNPLRNEISIEVAHGMSRVAMERGKYQIGERDYRQGNPGWKVLSGTQNQPGTTFFKQDSYKKGCPRSRTLLHLCSSKKGESGCWGPER